MRKKLKWIIPLILVVAIAAIYLRPTPRQPFDEIYANVDA